MSELDYVKALILGLVQGLTEFLPVSSSGHLAMVQSRFHLTGSSPPMLLFDVVTHAATVLAVIWVFAGTFRQFLGRLVTEAGRGFSGKRTAWLVAVLAVIACAPTAAIGLAFQDWFEAKFDSMTAVGIGLLVTGGLLFAIGHLPRPRRGWRRIGGWRAAAVGVVQGLAILPGVSRSGSTICVAIMLGIKRRWAAEFSFLIAVPAIVGALALKLGDTLELPADQLAAMPLGPILAGAFVALVSGIIALRLLLNLVIRDKLQHFCWYCWAVGLGILLLAWA